MLVTTRHLFVNFPAACGWQKSSQLSELNGFRFLLCLHFYTVPRLCLFIPPKLCLVFYHWTKNSYLKSAISRSSCGSSAWNILVNSFCRFPEVFDWARFDDDRFDFDLACEWMIDSDLDEPDPCSEPSFGWLASELLSWLSDWVESGWSRLNGSM